MGRYKRHQRKNKGTNIMVAMSPCQSKVSYSRRYNEGKSPQISERVKNLLNSNVSHKQKEKGKFISKFVGEVLLSIKKRNLYPNFLCLYEPNFKFEDDGSLVKEAFYLFRNNYHIYHIGDKVIYYPRSFPNCLASKDVLYDSLLSKIILFHSMVYIKHEVGFFTRHTRLISKDKLIEYYVTDELEKRNKKIYPNELYLSFLFGITFSVIGLIVISSILGQIFGMWATCVFSFFVVVCLLIWMIK